MLGIQLKRQAKNLPCIGSFCPRDISLATLTDATPTGLAMTLSTNNTPGAKQQRIQAQSNGTAAWRRWEPYLGVQCGKTTAPTRGLGLFQPRPCPQPCLPLGRRRYRRHQRQPTTALPRFGVVERLRPDTQETPVRID